MTLPHNFHGAAPANLLVLHEIARIRALLSPSRFVEPENISDYAREIVRLRALAKAAGGALKYYADTFCELGTYHECCGKLSDEQCSGCRAKSVLENRKADLADANSKSPIQAREE